MEPSWGHHFARTVTSFYAIWVVNFIATHLTLPTLSQPSVELRQPTFALSKAEMNVKCRVQDKLRQWPVQLLLLGRVSILFVAYAHASMQLETRKIDQIEKIESWDGIMLMTVMIHPP